VCSSGNQVILQGEISTLSLCQACRQSGSHSWRLACCTVRWRSEGGCAAVVGVPQCEVCSQGVLRSTLMSADAVYS
jgi:hypothetical protein